MEVIKVYTPEATKIYVGLNQGKHWVDAYWCGGDDSYLIKEVVLSVTPMQVKIEEGKTRIKFFANINGEDEAIEIKEENYEKLFKLLER